MRADASFDQRALKGSAVELEFFNRDMHGEPAVATETPTVAVTRRSDASSVTVGAVSAEGDPGRYVATVAAANNTLLDILDVTWTIDSVDHTTTCKVVGGFYFSLTEASGTYEVHAQPNSRRSRHARSIAEAECERITRVAWVPQMRERWIENDLLSHLVIVPDVHVRSLRSVEEYTTAGVLNYTWTADDLAGVLTGDAGVLTRRDAYWPLGTLRLVYDHGYDQPPPDVAEACMRRYRYWLARPTSAIPDRAESWSDESTSYRLMAGRDRTGDPDVDGVYWSVQFNNLGVA